MQVQTSTCKYIPVHTSTYILACTLKLYTSIDLVVLIALKNRVFHDLTHKRPTQHVNDFLSSSAVHLNPFCIGIYQYIQVCTGTYVYVRVRTSTYWYVLVCTCVQKQSCRARAHLGWTFSASWHWIFSLLAQEAVPEALSTIGTYLSDGPGSIAW